MDNQNPKKAAIAQMGDAIDLFLCLKDKTKATGTNSFAN
jgi:hypothetical protein